MIYCCWENLCYPLLKRFKCQKKSAICLWLPAVLLINKMSEKTFIPSEGISDTVSEENRCSEHKQEELPSKQIIPPSSLEDTFHK